MSTYCEAGNPDIRERGEDSSHRILVGVAMLPKPDPQKLLVNVLRLSARRHPPLVTAGCATQRNGGEMDSVKQGRRVWMTRRKLINAPIQ